MDNVTPLHRWEVVEFAWGTAVKEQRTGKYHRVFLFPDAQEINVEHLNVTLRDDGIQFN